MIKILTPRLSVYGPRCIKINQCFFDISIITHISYKVYINKCIALWNAIIFSSKHIREIFINTPAICKNCTLLHSTNYASKTKESIASNKINDRWSTWNIWLCINMKSFKEVQGTLINIFLFKVRIKSQFIFLLHHDFFFDYISTQLKRDIPKKSSIIPWNQ